MNFRGIIGIAAFLFIAWLVSENRRQVSIRDIITGLIFQVLMAFLVFKVPVVQSVLGAMNMGMEVLLKATRAGTSFVFGYIGGGGCLCKNRSRQYV